MSKARDEYVDLVFAKIERERAQRKEAHAALARAAVIPVTGKPPAFTPAPIALPTAADREFEAIRVAALARMQAEADARQAEAQAVAAILAAGPSAPSPLDTQTSPEDRAVAAILRAGNSPL